MIDPKDSLFSYPCDFPLKVFGIAQPEFAHTIAKLVQIHVPDFDEKAIEMRNSKNSKYISLTCTIHATSREQLDMVYCELTSHPMVKMVL